MDLVFLDFVGSYQYNLVYRLHLHPRYFYRIRKALSVGYHLDKLDMEYYL